MSMRRKIPLKLKNKTKNRSCYYGKPTPSSLKMSPFKFVPFALLIILALIVMIIAGGIGFVASGLMNTAIFLDRQAGDIRDGR